MQGAIKTALFLGVGLAAGFAIATLRPSKLDAPLYVDDGGATTLAERLGDLERRLASEVQARVRLTAEIDSLRAAVAAAPVQRGGGEGLPEGFGRIEERIAALRDGDGDGEASAEQVRERMEQFRDQRQRQRPTAEELEQRQIDRLVEAGFSPDRATWVRRRTDEIQLEQMQAEYEARRNGQPIQRQSVEQALRGELGDAEYERYLEGTGRPTRVAVVDVLPGSPGEQAGFRPGDQVLAYNGQRVFAPDDINRYTLEGHPGETVAVDIIRDGTQMQVYVPRGPIGITNSPVRNRGRRGGR